MSKFDFKTCQEDLIIWAEAANVVHIEGIIYQSFNNIFYSEPKKNLLDTELIWQETVTLTQAPLISSRNHFLRIVIWNNFCAFNNVCPYVISKTYTEWIREKMWRVVCGRKLTIHIKHQKLPTLDRLKV